ncbi:Arc family DNA-binding protein [Liquorilactobacillus uvarum]|uniref:Arc family DNA-binding protein n=1 Tax=Liquorilactobacillus uvarum TaxID=303240 RepID=UPI00288C5C91|nr:Arc family DNA-binding protein [Liquorilactobacillus uvarum]
MATFLLRLPQDLKKRLEESAKKQNRSVNSMLQTMIEDELGMADKPVASLEHRQFIGQVISSKQIDQDNGLVQVNGIFYRYLIESNLDFDPHKSYIVIEANGNILTLRPVEL